MCSCGVKMNEVVAQWFGIDRAPRPYPETLLGSVAGAGFFETEPTAPVGRPRRLRFVGAPSASEPGTGEFDIVVGPDWVSFRPSRSAAIAIRRVVACLLESGAVLFVGPLTILPTPAHAALVPAEAKVGARVCSVEEVCRLIATGGS